MTAAQANEIAAKCVGNLSGISRAIRKAYRLGLSEFASRASAKRKTIGGFRSMSAEWLSANGKAAAAERWGKRP